MELDCLQNHQLELFKKPSKLFLKLRKKSYSFDCDI